MEPNLKKSTILFVLRYVRYKGNLRFKGVPLIALSSEPSSASFFDKTYFWSWNLRCTFNWVPPKIHLLLNCFVNSLHQQVHHHVYLQAHLKCNLKYTLNFNLKCRCAFRWTIRNTLKCTDMFILKCKCHHLKHQVHPLCHFIVHLQLLSKRTLRCSFKSNIQTTITF